MSTKLVMVRGKAGRFTAGSVVEDTTLSTMATREQWLGSALALIRQYLRDKANVIVPDTTKVSCGLAGGRIGSKRIGECWSTIASADGFTEIFISPVLSNVTGDQGVLATLLHEAIHAAVGVDKGHKKPFKDAAVAAGLEGKMTATKASPSLMQDIAAWSVMLGNYPHAQMTASGRKKQSTRLVKCQCSECGYVVRTTAKWITVGAPLCPCNEQPMSVESDSDESESE